LLALREPQRFCAAPAFEPACYFAASIAEFVGRLSPRHTARRTVRERDFIADATESEVAEQTPPTDTHTLLRSERAWRQRGEDVRGLGRFDRRTATADQDHLGL
jgi:hypothetical protein